MKMLRSWKIHRISGDPKGLCVSGTKEDGTPWNTTKIAHYRAIEGGVIIRTQSGSEYHLPHGEMIPGLWPQGLMMHRPEVNPELWVALGWR